MIKLLPRSEAARLHLSGARVPGLSALDPGSCICGHRLALAVRHAS